jgi:formamidopyrimidine-DNA glycosylase
MPELPEVELLKLGLNKYVRGLTIGDVDLRYAKIFDGKVGSVVGGKVVNVRRYGKMLAVDLSNGKSLAVHVKMTGRLIYRGKRQPKKLDVEEDLENLPNKHTHAIFSFKNGDKLYYLDVRKFGWIKVVDSQDVEKIPFVSKLGPEPFKDLKADDFHTLLLRYRRPIKTLLMDQSRISGVGNIYANEALFCAGISPKRISSKISKDKSKKLYDCILKVFMEGMKFGGSSTDSFRDVLGEKGKYQEHYGVYDREGKACKRRGCKGNIQKMKMGGRGTYYCSKCQK